LFETQAAAVQTLLPNFIGETAAKKERWQQVDPDATDTA
jgi:hypothetical protein